MAIIRKMIIFIVLTTPFNVNALTIENGRNILQLLKNNEFAQLEILLTEYVEAFEEDLSNERNLDQALEALSSNHPWMEDSIKKWIKHSPDSYLPNLTYGIYHMSVGWTVRGQKSRKYTSEEQYEQLQYHANIAKLNFKKVIRKKPEFVHVYAYLINLSMHDKTDVELNNYYKKGLEVNKYSHRLHMFYAFSLQPRWGGSLEALKLFGAMMDKLFEKNSILKGLIGLDYVEDADQEFYYGDINKAIDYYKTAEKKGTDYWYLYFNMAEAYRRNDQHEKAIEYYKRVLTLRPMYSDVYYGISKSKTKLSLNKEALDMALIAIEINSEEYDFNVQLAQCYFNLDQLENSLIFAERGLEIKPDDKRLRPFIQHVKAIIRMKARDSEKIKS